MENDEQFGLGDIESLAVDTVTSAKYLAVEVAGHSGVALKGNLLTSTAIGSVAVIDAAKNEI